MFPRLRALATFCFRNKCYLCAQMGKHCYGNMLYEVSVTVFPRLRGPLQQLNKNLSNKKYQTTNKDIFAFT